MSVAGGDLIVRVAIVGQTLEDVPFGIENVRGVGVEEVEPGCRFRLNENGFRSPVRIVPTQARMNQYPLRPVSC